MLTPLTLAATSTYLKSGVATATGQTISYTLVSGPATLSNGVLTFTGVGSVVVTASVSATGDFGAGTSPQATITVGQGTPVITFTSSNTVAFGTTLTVAATSTLGTPTFTEANGTGTATLSGSTLTPTGIGSVTITASVASTTNYKSATAQQSVSITAAIPTVTVTSTSGTYGVPLTLTATSTYLKNGVATATGQTISYVFVSGPATLSSGVLTFTGIGSVVVKASVSATGNFGAGSVTQTINVSAATPTVTVTSTSGNYGTPLTLTATSTYLKNGVATATGQTISYALVSGPATLSNGVLTFTGVSPVVVTASVSATGDFGAAISPQTTITVVMTTPMPTFSPMAGTYATIQNVAINDSDPNAAIYYTTDGTTPSVSSNPYPSGYLIYVQNNETLKAIAVDAAYANSAVATAVYNIQAAPPTFSPAAGSYVGSQTVTITDTTSSNAKIYYTTNGTSATTGSTPYPSAGITVSASETINAVAAVSGYATSLDVPAAYTITSAPAPPVISLASGTYTGAQLVTINETSLNATVYYTLGNPGTKPGTSSNVYTGGALTISSSETLETYAVFGSTSSSVVTATYTLPGVTTPTTTLAVTSGGSPVTTVSSDSQVTLTAKVASGATAVTLGTVVFCDGTATTTSKCTDIHLLGTSQLTSAGTAAINLRPGAGSHTYNAIFVGTSTYLTSSSSNAQLAVTGTYPTTTTITGTGIASGQITLTAQVAGVGSNNAIPSGTVSAVDTSNGNAVLGTASLSPAATSVALSNASTISFPLTNMLTPNVIAVGDFNGDGIPDLAMISFDNMSVTIMLGQVGGGFQPAPGSPVMLSGNPYTLAVGDFNGDGNLDLAVVTGCCNLSVLIGNGHGGFSNILGPFTNITDINQNQLIAVGDFNRDGKLDIAVVDEEAPNLITVMLGNGDGTFTQANGSATTPFNSDFVAVGDFNEDGIPDLAVASYGDPITIFKGNGDGTFTEGQQITIPRPEAEFVAVGDFCGLGHQDLAITNFNEPDVYIVQNKGDGTGTFDSPTSIAVGNGPVSVVVGDFNNDGLADLAVANNIDSTVSILLNNPNMKGTFFTSSTISINPGPASYWNSDDLNGPQDLVIGDFNQDGVPDVAAVSYNNGVGTGTSLVSILQTNLSENATATITGISPVGGGTHNVDANYGGVTTSGVSFTSSTSATVPLTIPWITGITPPSGVPGTFVRISGSNFGIYSAGNSLVTFNGVSAQVTNWTATSIDVIAPPESSAAPAGVTTGPVVVTTYYPTFVSNAVTFTASAGPTITGLSPVLGPIGSNVTISGFNFPTSSTAGTVSFSGVPASPTTWGSETIITPVPTGATTGPVVVTLGGVPSNSYTYTVGAGITGIAPAQGNVGTPVTISGTGFGTNKGGVTFNGVPAIPSNWSDTSITVPVPSGATTGNVAVLANGATTVGPVFQLLPVISSLSPSVGPVGTVVTISGSNFGSIQGNSSIAFGQISAVPTNWSQDTIVVPVPIEAVTSPVVVTVQTQTSNAVPFTIGSSSTATLTGTVTKSDGVTPIAGATITVFNGSSQVATAATGASGTYALSNLSVNTYSLRATAFGFGVQGQTGVTVSSTQPTVVNFSLPGEPAIAYTYDELGRLVGVVDPVNGTAGYSYDAVGNITSITRSTVGQVSILDFTPKSGPVGTAVTVSGTSFGTNAQQDTVTFTGASTIATSATSNQITVAVPASAATGPITVTTPSGTATSSASYTVTANSGAPSIGSFTPAIAVASTSTPVTITGTNFDVLANDRVSFNGALASLTSATPTIISATLPANATSGPITVATPTGNATSSSEFFLIPAAYLPAQVDFTGQVSQGGSYTGTIVNGGDIGLVLFSATAGQQLNLQVNGSTIASATVSIMGPGGSLLEQGTIGAGGSIIDSFIAPTAGTYTILTGSNGPTYTGTLTFNLSQASSSGTPTGSTMTGQVEVTTAGQSAQMTFSGSANQLASVTVTNSTFSVGCYALTVSIVNPANGNTLGSAGTCSSSLFLAPVTLPANGPYTVVVAPAGGGIGTATVTISLFGEQTIPITSVVNGTTEIPITINTPGQNAAVTFSGQQNQLASFWISNSNFPGCASVNFNILDPTGANVGSGYMCNSTGFVGPVSLNTTGTYTLQVSPTSGGTGSAVVALSLFNQQTGTITSGTAVPVIINLPGQSDLLTFNGTANQVASLQISNSTFPNCASMVVSILQNGTSLFSNSMMCGSSGSMTLGTLPANGPYTLEIAPTQGGTGSASVTLTLQ